jgi:hypothetical protein
MHVGILGPAAVGARRSPGGHADAVSATVGIPEADAVLTVPGQGRRP